METGFSQQLIFSLDCYEHAYVHLVLGESEEHGCGTLWSTRGQATLQGGLIDIVIIDCQAYGCVIVLHLKLHTWTSNTAQCVHCSVFFPLGC